MSMQPDQQNFRVALPPATHRIPATCEEVDCPHYLEGWMTIVAVDSRQANYIRRYSGRQFTVTKTGENILEYKFAAGQECFRDHTRLSGRPPFYLHETREGRRMHTAENFVEHAHEEMDKNERFKREAGVK